MRKYCIQTLAWKPNINSIIVDNVQEESKLSRFLREKRKELVIHRLFNDSPLFDVKSLRTGKKDPGTAITVLKFFHEFGNIFEVNGPEENPWRGEVCHYDAQNALPTR